MKYYLFLFFLMMPYFLMAQYFEKQRFGINLSISQYATKTNFFSSKPALGYSAGVTIGVPLVKKKIELLTELKVNRHNLILTGRKTEDSPPSDLNFYIENIGISTLAHYCLYQETNSLAYGVSFGPTVALFYDLNNSKIPNQWIEPYMFKSDRLKVDTMTGLNTFNIFLSLGVSAHNKFLMASLRYYQGVTNPYRTTKIDGIQELKATDSYLNFTLTVFP